MAHNQSVPVGLPRYKAMTNLSRPRQIDYELEFSPAAGSLPSLSTLKVNAKVLLRNDEVYIQSCGAKPPLGQRELC